MKNAIFLDRDGVVNTMIKRGDKLTSPRSISEWVWEPGIHVAVEKIKKNGYFVFIVTNQPEIARKTLDQNILEKFHQMIRDELSVDDIAVCLHDDADNCFCRKPKAGMLVELAKKWDIDLKNSVMVGDRGKDIVAGEAVGCTTVLINKDYNKGVSADYLANDLFDFTNNFLSRL